MTNKNGYNFRYKDDKYTIFTQVYEEEKFVIGVRNLTDTDAVKFATDEIDYVIYENGAWKSVVELINESSDTVRY